MNKFVLLRFEILTEAGDYCFQAYEESGPV
jgi:hypothetical protein